MLLIVPALLILTVVYKMDARKRGKSPHHSIPLNDLNRHMVHSNIFTPLFYAGFLAPFSGLVWSFAVQIQPKPFLAYPFIFMGVCGIAFPLIWTITDLSWRLQQLRQIRNLATSPAGAAALGFAELRGTARAQYGDGLLIGENNDANSWIRPFYLEDKTGRIFIDPSGAVIRERKDPVLIWKSFYFSFRKGWRQLMTGGLCEVVLQRRPGGKRELRDGDTVYVLGNVEMDEKAPGHAVDSQRLVVRRNRRYRRPSWWTWLLLRDEAHSRDRYYDMFFLTNKDENDAKKQILRDAAALLSMTVPWAITSILTINLGLSLL
jgi:hypothetical protein